MGAIKRGLKNTKYGNQFILKLLENKIIEFGAKVRCTVCEQAGFFLPGEVLPDMNCPICRNSFKLPMARPDLIEWAYRGIGPFARNNKADGVMSVFATLRLFLEHIADDKKITSLFGFELIKPGQTDPKEIDLCLLSGDRHDNFKQSELIMCECKTYVHLKDVDIERMKMLGDEFPGAILTIATLNEHLTADEVRLLTGLVQHFQTGEGDRPRNPVLILTGTELLNPDISFPLGKYEDQMQGFQRHNDFIGALCELTVKKHLAIRNWGEIKMDRWNEEIYRRQTIGNIVDAVLKLKSADARVSE